MTSVLSGTEYIDGMKLKYQLRSRHYLLSNVSARVS